MKKLSNAVNLGFDNSYFYEILWEKDGHFILSKPGEEDLYVVKIPSESAGFMIDKRNDKNVSEALSEYLGNCDLIAKDLKNGDFDVRSLSTLESMMTEYMECK